MTSVENFFGINGALAQVVKGYQPRAAQIEMAVQVNAALNGKYNLIAEAGTGTGKTFAYLIPALLSEQKVIVATATKNLQDQLFTQDLPLIQKALEQPIATAILKGRSNYLCLYRLKNALDSTYGFNNKADAKALVKINTWSKSTQDGDITQMGTVTENNPIWLQATSSKDNCLGSECKDYEACFLVKARKTAQDADIVVVNHHLLCADWSMRNSGLGELLPNPDVIILDEAHKISEIASNFLGISIGASQINALSDDILAEFLMQAANKSKPVITLCSGLKKHLQNLRLQLGKQIRTAEWQEIASDLAIMQLIHEINPLIQALESKINTVKKPSKGLEICAKRCQDLVQALDDLLDDNINGKIRWFETQKYGFTFHATPLEIAPEFQILMQQYAKSQWIFTSATLSVADSFEHFKNNLGLKNVTSFKWDSPFNYPEQALFYHPKGLPQPNDKDAINKIVEFVLPVLEASQGRAFFLFTSYRALNLAAELLADKIEYPLLIQGKDSKSNLLKKFKQHGNAVLLATASFWEGVDVRGEALSCVIIDKLPFASPFEPVLKARLEAMKQSGKNGFIDYQVPIAAIALRQGVGRLIRDANDNGVLMVCDPRLLKRGYGQIFLDSIPNMRRTREIQDVNDFFA